MIRSLVIAGAIAFATPATAQLDANVWCPVIGELGEQVMTARQNGISMSRVLGMTNEVPGAAGEMANSMVRMAYQELRSSSPTRQRDAIADFVIKVEVQCYEAFGDL
jgi:hypothetical protein